MDLYTKVIVQRQEMVTVSHQILRIQRFCKYT